MKILNDILKEDDLVIVTGEDFRVYGRLVFDEKVGGFIFTSDEYYNEKNPNRDKVELFNNTRIEHIVGCKEHFHRHKNTSVDIFRQTDESRIGKRIFFIEK